jgi:hypothetical protein
MSVLHSPADFSIIIILIIINENVGAPDVEASNVCGSRRRREQAREDAQCCRLACETGYTMTPAVKRGWASG